MTVPQIQAKIEYCLLLRGKHELLEKYFAEKVRDLALDLHRLDPDAQIP